MASTICTRKEIHSKIAETEQHIAKVNFVILRFVHNVFWFFWGAIGARARDWWRRLKHHTWFYIRRIGLLASLFKLLHYVVELALQLIRSPRGEANSANLFPIATKGIVCHQQALDVRFGPCGTLDIASSVVLYLFHYCHFLIKGMKWCAQKICYIFVVQQSLFILIVIQGMEWNDRCVLFTLT